MPKSDVKQLFTITLCLQCDPNLAVYGVWINHLDPRLPRIALFAKKDIARGEELTFDYMMTGTVDDMCFCYFSKFFKCYLHVLLLITISLIAGKKKSKC